MNENKANKCVSNTHILRLAGGTTYFAVAMGVTWYLIYYFDKCQSTKDFFIKMGSMIASNRDLFIAVIITLSSIIIGVTLLGKAIESCCSESKESQGKNP
jgi:hypothetical protein